MKPIKMLLVGDSKAGKTGALGSLLLAGYTLRVIDTDNGTDIIRGLPEVKKGGEEVLTRLDVQTCTDSYTRKSQAGKLSLVADATTWGKVLDLFDKWPDKGPVENWGDGDVLVIDSLSFLAQAALRHVCKLNNRIGKAFDTDIGDTQSLIRGLLELLFSVSLKCHVIVISHLDYRGGNLFSDRGSPSRPAPVPDHIDLAMEKGYPLTIGKALNTTIGRYFNTLFLVKVIGQGEAMKRVICTKNTLNGTAMVDLSSVDLAVPAQLPIETGLADYFKVIRGDVGVPVK